MSIKILYYLLLAELLLVKFTENAEILGIFPIRTRSYAAFNNLITKTLAAKGHRVTALNYSPIKEKIDNYKFIDLSESTIDVKNFVDTVTINDTYDLRGFNYIFNLLKDDFEETLCHAVFSHPYIQKLLKSEIPSPDLIITEIIQLPCYLSISEKLNIPTVGLIAPLNYGAPDYIIGNPGFPSYLPFFLGEFTQNMNFFQRTINSIQYIILYVIHIMHIERKTLELDEKYVGNKDITIDKLYKRMNLFLYNSQPVIFNRPYVPNAIEVGGCHIKKPQPLPNDIQKFIDEAKDGVIFFSFGTTVKTSSFPPVVLKMFKEVFAKIPQRVIWRFDAPNIMTGVSENVMIRDWFPQRDILEHKNVKAFISHGGIFGTFEAIHTGTPVIGIPFIYDQFLNIKLLEEKSVAIYLDYNDLTRTNLLKTLKEIFNNTKYYKNMQNLSNVFRDQPIPPIDKAMYWIDYVIRHKGAPHLRSKTADMTFFQYLCLDVTFFIIFILSFVIYLMYILIKFSYRTISKPKIRIIMNSKKNQ